MDTQRIKDLAKAQGKTLKHICAIIGRPSYYLNDLAKKETAIMSAADATTIAHELNTTTEYLLGLSDDPSPMKAIEDSITPYEKRGVRPVIGVASAGRGVIADEDIIGWQSVDPNCDTEDYFWFKISGDSMSHKIEDGDLVLVQKNACVTNLDIVVAIVDNDEGYIKQFIVEDDTIILHSINPAYSDMEFRGSERDRIYIVGKARKVERDL